MNKHIVFFILVMWCVATCSVKTASAEDLQQLKKEYQESSSILKKNYSDHQALKKAALTAHMLSALKEEGMSEASVRLFTKLVEIDPANAEYMAYLGSSYTMYGRDAQRAIDKIKNVNKGQEFLNKAVQMSPEDTSIRLIRAEVGLALPSMFQQLETILNDYLYVASRSAHTSVLTPEKKAELFYKVGVLADKLKKQDIKNKYLQKAIEVAPDSSWAAKAKEKMG